MNLEVDSGPAGLGRSLDRDEAALWREYRQKASAASREQLFGHYFGFARSIANRLYRERNYGDIERDELSQLAAAGLLQAIDHFDPGRGSPFRAYAARRITGSILDGLAKMSEAREQQSLRYRLRNERIRSLTGERSGEGLSPGEALEALIEAAVGLAIGFMLEGTSLYVADEAGPPERAANAYESLAWKELVERLMREVQALPERERLIVRQHYLRGQRFDQIGAEIGVTKGRVSQIHRQAMDRLRQGLASQGHFRLER